MNLQTPIKPMLLSETEQIPNLEEWLFQVKMDGFRSIYTYQKASGNRLFTRHGNEFTRQFPEFEKKFPYDSIVLDGETVVIEQGKPILEKVLSRLKSRAPLKQTPNANFMAFDILYLNGERLTHLPVIERLQILNSLDLPESFAICPSHPDGNELFLATERLGLEGIVAKRKTSRYIIDKRATSWLKIKHYTYTKAVVVGIQSYPFFAIVRTENGQRQAIKFAKAHVKTGLRKQGFRLPAQSNEFIPLPHLPECIIKHPGFTYNGQLREPILFELVG